MLVVSPGKVSLCRENNTEIKSLVEIKPKEAGGMLKTQVLRDANLEHLSFLMNSRKDLVELVEISITQEAATPAVKQFYRVDGTIRDFKLHPSNDYVVILTDQGFYYVFGLENGDIRAKLQCPKTSRDLQIDPSGLYLSVIADD